MTLNPALFSDQMSALETGALAWLSLERVRVTKFDDCGVFPHLNRLVPLAHRVRSTSESIEECVFGFHNLEIRWIAASHFCSGFCGQGRAGSEEWKEDHPPMIYGYNIEIQFGDR